MQNMRGECSGVQQNGSEQENAGTKILSGYFW
jgi:hypothetical protein